MHASQLDPILPTPPRWPWATATPACSPPPPASSASGSTGEALVHSAGREQGMDRPLPAMPALQACYVGTPARHPSAQATIPFSLPPMAHARAARASWAMAATTPFGATPQAPWDPACPPCAWAQVGAPPLASQAHACCSSACHAHGTGTPWLINLRKRTSQSSDLLNPSPPAAFQNRTVVDISAGGMHTCAAFDDGGLREPSACS